MKTNVPKRFAHGAFTSILLLGACATTTPVASNPDAARLARFTAQTEALRTRLGIPGISAVILRDEQVVWAKGFGYADYEHRVPATPDTVYPIASETKPMAATLVMQLVEQGKVGLDDPASKYSGDFKDDRIKVKHLLSHTAGSPTPGDAFAYDPHYYEYLTQVIEKATGKPVREVFAETLLDPLGMTSSVPGPDVLKDPKWADVLGQERMDRYAQVLTRQAQPYTSYGEGEVVHVGYPGGFFGASAGMLSTVLDMAKFDAAIDRHVLLKPATQDQAWSHFPSNAGQPLPYGLGWYVRDYEGRKVVWHGGNWGTGFSAIYVKVPERHLSLIMLSNSEVLNGHMYAVGDEDIVHNAFACTFLHDFVYEAVPALDCETSSDAAVAKYLEQRKAHAHPVVAVDPRRVDAVSGQYRFEFDPTMVLTFASKDGKLYTDVPARAWTEVYAQSPATFFFKIRPAEVTFVEDKGQVTGLDWAENGKTYRANRISKGSVSGFRTVAFACTSGDSVMVRFSDDQRVAVLVRNGEEMTLQQQPSASGFVYGSGPNTIRGKGDDLTVETGRAAPLECKAG